MADLRIVPALPIGGREKERLVGWIGLVRLTAKQRDPQISLDPSDSVAYGTMRDANFLSGVREALMPCSSLKKAETGEGKCHAPPIDQQATGRKAPPSMNAAAVSTRGCRIGPTAVGTIPAPWAQPEIVARSHSAAGQGRRWWGVTCRFIGFALFRDW